MKKDKAEMTEIQTKLEVLQDNAKSPEVDILATQEQLHNETDETHITFLTDHLNMLRFELDQTNADIYLLRKKIKKSQLN